MIVVPFRNQKKVQYRKINMYWFIKFKINVKFCLFLNKLKMKLIIQKKTQLLSSQPHFKDLFLRWKKNQTEVKS